MIEDEIVPNNETLEIKKDSGTIKRQQSVVESVSTEESKVAQREENLTEKDILEGALNLFGGNIREE